MVPWPPGQGNRWDPKWAQCGPAKEDTWGIPAATVGEDLPIDIAQKLWQSMGEEGEIQLVSDEVPSPAQEIH